MKNLKGGNTMIIEIKVPSERVIGMNEIKEVEITDEEIVKLIDRYFEIKGIEIKEIGII